MNGNMEQVRDALASDGVIEGAKSAWPRQTATDGQKWCMIAARPGAEINVANGLRRYDMPAYWPNFEEIVVSRDQAGVRRDRVHRRALIPGVVFGPPAAAPLVDLTRDAFGLVLTFSGDPLFLREQDIQLIRAIEAHENTPAVPTKVDHHGFKLGDKVRLLDDLMAIWPPGKVTKLAHGGRISVEMSLMARKVTIKVLPHQIGKL
jgi:transcription antitermination factor NusG